MERISEGFDRIFLQFWDRITKFHFGSTVFDATFLRMKTWQKRSWSWDPSKQEFDCPTGWDRRVLKTNRHKPVLWACLEKLQQISISKQFDQETDGLSLVCSMHLDQESGFGISWICPFHPPFNTMIKEEINPILDKLTCIDMKIMKIHYNMNLQTASDWFEAVWNVIVWLYHMTPRPRLELLGVYALLLVVFSCTKLCGTLTTLRLQRREYAFLSRFVQTLDDSCAAKRQIKSHMTKWKTSVSAKAQRERDMRKLFGDSDGVVCCGNLDSILRSWNFIGISENDT